jgi:DNA polymerase IV
MVPDGRQPTILHADLDAFYASVEQLLDPHLRHRPMAVGGGVVLAASYEARAFGVRGGMSGRQARALCPQIVFVPGHFREYQKLGDEVIEVLRTVTPVVERVSIDEAFLDVAGSVHLFGPPETIARALRARVRSEVGLPISIGVASTKHLAKVASQVAKPDGLVVVDPDHESEFLAPLPVGLLWGVGPKTGERLAGLGVHTIGQLAEVSPQALTGLLGQAAGSKLTSLAANVDPRRVRSGPRSRSVGAQAAVGRRHATHELVRTTMAFLADRVGSRMRAAGRAGRTVTVRVRFADLRSVTRSRTLSAPIDTTLTLTEVAEALVHSALADHPDEPEVSLLGLSVSNLGHHGAVQLELPLEVGTPTLRPGSATSTSRWAIDRAVDQVRERFGREAVGFARSRLGADVRVPDGFRELAERDL